MGVIKDIYEIGKEIKREVDASDAEDAAKAEAVAKPAVTGTGDSVSRSVGIDDRVVWTGVDGVERHGVVVAMLDLDCVDIELDTHVAGLPRVIHRAERGKVPGWRKR
jgi:hypothetical protein